MLGGQIVTKSISQRALASLHAGRPKNPNVRRDSKGKSRGEPEVIAPEVLTYRKRDLQLDGIKDEHASDALAGYSLGRLLLRHRQDESDPGSVSQKQFDAGLKWCGIVHRHAAIMGYRLSTTPIGIVMQRGGKTPKEPDDETIAYVRGQFKACYNGLQSVSQTHGWRLSEVCYGIAVENWPIRRLALGDYGLLRTGLNCLAKVLG